MTIPSRILSSVRALLRIPDAVTISNARITTAYETAIAELVRETDIFASLQFIDAVADQSIYTATAGTTRILAVQHNRTQLMLVPSRSLDLLTTWQKDESGEPEIWTMDKLPPSLDGLVTTSPLQFAIHPAPLVNGTGLAGLVVTRIGLPVDDEIPSWLFPYFIYKSAAIYSGESSEERDIFAAQLWGEIANIWKELMGI